jgi:CRISPR/Cas system-associated exonuclease Cas4 (RecB family)
MSSDPEVLLAQLQKEIPRRPFVPSVVEVAGAAMCPRSVLLKVIYGASGEYNAGLAIGTVTHSVLAELGRIESRIVEEVDRSLPENAIAQQIYSLWLEMAEAKIDGSWRFFADARISAQEGRDAILRNLQKFSHHLAEEVREGYRRPDRIITGHHIINLDLPLEGIPDEYRVFSYPSQIEIREFKSYGGSKVTEITKLQACAYQLLLEQIHPDIDFTIKVFSTDDVVNVRMTESRRSKLLESIATVKRIYETGRGTARAIPQICEVCSLNDACQYYFRDVQPAHVRRYLWRLRMETLEEKGLSQVWKWKSMKLPTDARVRLGYADTGYRIVETQPHSVRLSKDERINNILPGDTVIVSGGDPLCTPSFTGEVSDLDLGENSLTVFPYRDLPLGLPNEGLVVDYYDVDLTRRQLKSIDIVHRSSGRAGELARKILGIESPRPLAGTSAVQIMGDLNQEQRQAVLSALNAPDFMVVLGPPGTGKTAVIVELLTLLAQQGKRALAVSVTNTAVDNIVERLLDQGHRFGIRFGNWYKIRERAMEAALINILTNEEDRALAAVERMRTAAAVLTTCSSASLDLVKAGQFDVVIFEEASQIRMQDAFGALVQAEKAIIIGDDRQLPPVSQLHRQVSSLLEIALATLNRHNLTEDLVTPLLVQYRMQREICDLINRRFYDNTLLSAPSIEARSPLSEATKRTGLPQLDRVLDPAISIGVIDVEGVEDHRGYSLFNQTNLVVDSLLIGSFRSAGLASGQIGVITPYKEQQRRLTVALGREADVGTVDGFQGQERDVVILDLVRANPDREIGFTLDPNRLNVALSRARQKLVIVANLPTYEGHAEFDQTMNLIRSLPHTCIEHVTAEQLGVQLPEYRRRREIKITPGMVDSLEEPKEQPPTERIARPGGYFDVY